MYNDSNRCRLMIQFTKDETQPAWHGYFYTVLFFVNALVLSLILHQYFHRVNLTGMRIRTAVIAAVYNKVNHQTFYGLISPQEPIPSFSVLPAFLHTKLKMPGNQVYINQT